MPTPELRARGSLPRSNCPCCGFCQLRSAQTDRGPSSGWAFPRPPWVVSAHQGVDFDHPVYRSRHGIQKTPLPFPGKVFHGQKSCSSGTPDITRRLKSPFPLAGDRLFWREKVGPRPGGVSSPDPKVASLSRRGVLHDTETRPDKRGVFIFYQKRPYLGSRSLIPSQKRPYPDTERVFFDAERSSL